jgi:cobaltochelatase CobS
MLEIKKVVKVADEKAKVLYVNAEGKEVVSDRKLYERKNKKYFVFIVEGYQYAVRFNNDGTVASIKYRGENNKLTKKQQEIDIELTKEVKAEPVAKVEIKVEKPNVIKHKEFETIKACVVEKLPVYLYGPAGSGKNHVLQQIAEELGLDFYFANSVQQEHKITGYEDASGKYHETEFYRAWTKGGLFFLDEMDASIPEVLILLNAALANGYFDFNNGEGRLDAHPEFRVVAAGNTVGTGADEQYTGRLQLDQATLDRFIFIEFDYDKNIELAIAKGNVELVNFIRDLRDQATQKGVNTTFSYRCIAMVTKLEGKLELTKVLTMAVIKGLDKDTLGTFNTNPANKYSKALWMLKQAK